mmetsp:Transcript_28603/g.72785  ORF Transcript_28603/g.72785 Transcript_28603/m.72785 type:complete len:225 (-) Transcript_28603:290-964(-)
MPSTAQTAHLAHHTPASAWLRFLPGIAPAAATLLVTSWRGLGCCCSCRWLPSAPCRGCMVAPAAACCDPVQPAPPAGSEPPGAVPSVRLYLLFCLSIRRMTSFSSLSTSASSARRESEFLGMRSRSSIAVFHACSRSSLRVRSALLSSASLSIWTMNSWNKLSTACAAELPGSPLPEGEPGCTPCCTRAMPAPPGADSGMGCSPPACACGWKLDSSGTGLPASV